MTAILAIFPSPAFFVHSSFLRLPTTTLITRTVNWLVDSPPLSLDPSLISSPPVIELETTFEVNST